MGVADVAGARQRAATHGQVRGRRQIARDVERTARDDPRIVLANCTACDPGAANHVEHREAAVLLGGSDRAEIEGAGAAATELEGVGAGADDIADDGIARREW